MSTSVCSIMPSGFARSVRLLCVLRCRRLVDAQRTTECRFALPSGGRFDHGRVLRDEQRLTVPGNRSRRRLAPLGFSILYAVGLSDCAFTVPPLSPASYCLLMDMLLGSIERPPHRVTSPPLSRACWTSTTSTRSACRHSPLESTTQFPHCQTLQL